jgi:GntR family carbon starvation induced transcriptional regulator
MNQSGRDSSEAITGTESSPTMSGEAYSAIRSDILAGDIEPGAKLKMEDLQSRYRFSSSPLREALSRLVAEQIVTVDGRKGFRAARVSQDDLRDITRFRLIVEPNAFEESIAHGTVEWEAGIISAFHRLQARESALPAAEKSYDSLRIQLHKEFHIALVSACDSARLLAACSAMFDQSQRYRNLSARHRASPRNAGAEHRRLMELALHRDQVGGRQLLGEHVQKTANHVLKYLARVEGTESDFGGRPGAKIRA